MNLNELNKIEEGILSSIGNAIKDRYQQGSYQTRVQDIFIKDFVQDAITSLNNGVRGGLVDPKAKSTTAPTEPATSDTETPGGPTAPGEAPYKWSPSGSAITPDTKLSDFGPVGGKDKPTTGAPAAPKSAPTTPPTPTPPTAPKAGPTTPKTAPTSPAAPKAAPIKPTPYTPAEKAKEKKKTEMLKLTGGRSLSKNSDGTFSAYVDDPSDSENSIIYTFDKDYNLVNTRSTKPGKTTKESRYHKMNRIFESIINVNEATELRTISDFMMDWFSQYMQGVNWDSSKAIVQQKLNKLQDQYPKNVKDNLTDLARIGLALSKTSTPAGAPKEFTQAKKQEAGSIEELKSALASLAKSDPAGYNELIKTLKPVTVA